MKKNILIFFWSFIFLGVGFLSISYNSVFAQQTSLGLWPPLLEVFIKPDKSILVAYRLENYGDPVVIIPKISTFIPIGNSGNIKINETNDGPIKFNLENSDIQLDQPFFLKNNENQQALLKIRVPEGAPEGDYYYTFMFETKPQNSFSGENISYNRATIGSNILITVTKEGNVEINGKIIQFEVLPKYKLNFFGEKINFFESSDKIPVILTIRNGGKNLIKPNGKITLTGKFNEKSSYSIIPQNILSESNKIVKASPSAEFDKSNDVSLVLSDFFVGKYDLSTSLNFGENTPIMYANTSFIALPIKLIFALIISIVILFFIIKRVYKNLDL